MIADTRTVAVESADLKREIAAMRKALEYHRQRAEKAERDAAAARKAEQRAWAASIATWDRGRRRDMRQETCD
jgi:hypothetical protein